MLLTTPTAADPTTTHGENVLNNYPSNCLAIASYLLKVYSLPLLFWPSHTHHAWHMQQEGNQGKIGVIHRTSSKCRKFFYWEIVSVTFVFAVTLFGRNCHLHPLLFLLLDGGGKDWFVLVHGVKAGRLVPLSLLRLATSQGWKLGQGVLYRCLSPFVGRGGWGGGEDEGRCGGWWESLLSGETPQLLERTLGPRLQLGSRRWGGGSIRHVVNNLKRQNVNTLWLIDWMMCSPWCVGTCCWWWWKAYCRCSICEALSSPDEPRHLLSPQLAPAPREQSSCAHSGCPTGCSCVHRSCTGAVGPGCGCACASPAGWARWTDAGRRGTEGSGRRRAGVTPPLPAPPCCWLTCRCCTMTTGSPSWSAIPLQAGPGPHQGPTGPKKVIMVIKVAAVNSLAHQIYFRTRDILVCCGLGLGKCKSKIESPGRWSMVTIDWVHVCIHAIK